MKGLIFLLLLLTTNAFSQETIIGRVINVKDGDSFTLVDDNNKFHEIRLVKVQQ